MSWVELDRIVSEEILRDDDIRRRVAASGRPLRSHATGTSDNDLLAKLRGLGVDVDREKLAELCDGALSAEEVVSERLGLHDRDADWAWICLTELWQRWWPEKACLELLDDKVQEGYAADQRNDFAASGRTWLSAWSDVLRMCDAIGVRSIREFDDRFPMTQSLFNWCQDLEMALQNGGEHDPELRTARLEMAAEWLRRFRSEDGLTTGNFRRALAGSYFETGHQQKADELYQSWLDDDPAWGWGWIGWADCYTPYGPGKTQNYARAEEILRRGSAVTGVREAEHIAGRLADICGRTGRPDEAREFRQQAEKDRQRAGQRAPRATAWAAPTTPAGESRAAKQRVAPAGKTGRNQPCPCGSGKKFNGRRSSASTPPTRSASWRRPTARATSENSPIGQPNTSGQPDGDHDQVRADTDSYGGYVISGWPDYVRRACDASLKRLGTDHIDPYYQHRLDARRN